MPRRALPALATAAAFSLVAACSGTDAPAPEESPATSEDATSAEPTSEPESSEPSSSGSTAEGTARDVIDDPPEQSWQDALDAAQQEFSGDVIKIELEPQHREGLEYKIELVSADAEYSVQYDADTLEKLSDEQDSLDADDDEHEETFDPSTLIDLDEAVSAARDQQDGTITSWKIEGDDNGPVQYEFDILPDGATDDVEVHINATDGSVINDS